MNIFNINILKNVAILKEKMPLISSIMAGMIVGICLLGIVMPRTTNADFANNTYASYVAKESTKEAKKVVQKIKVVITAYSSTPEETDDTPFTTASGTEVRDGVIANNMLPIGTKVRIPELYGDKVFTVEDRMNRRKSDYHFDIWFPSKTLALNFGVQTAEIEVLEN
jgi:3D (Asp-Asp-Asp) domain-containing protein